MTFYARDISEYVALDADINKGEAYRAVVATIEFIAKAIEHGDSIKLPPLGTFEFRTVPAKDAREVVDNLHGARVACESRLAHSVPKFKFYKALRNKVIAATQDNPYDEKAAKNKNGWMEYVENVETE